MEKYPADKAIKEVKEKGAIVINVGMPFEYAAEHIPGSINLPIEDVEAGKNPDVPKDTKIFLHCGSGGRAEKVKNILRERGYKKVENIGGLVDWERAGGDVERMKNK
ncbi:MAG: rhodanese-like domain-containing protein [Candidatus Spechtbacterales bacterium]|nr:rhodanese-like domain-containing protein [Candidatus Spechtbacterales bacterium]